MDFISMYDIVLAISCLFIYICFHKIFNHYRHHVNIKASSLFPALRMFLNLFLNVHRAHDWCTELLGKSRSGTVRIKGPSFSNLNLLVTSNPDNIHYIMSSNSANFRKGAEFKKIFDVLGDGIFNADYDSWKIQRKIALGHMNNHNFYKFVVKTTREKVETGLIPILDNIADRRNVVDLQNLFQRFTFDSTFLLVTGYDPRCLSIDFHEVEFATALDDAEEAIFYRHIKSEKLCRLQRLLRIGTEKKLMKAKEIFERVISNYISLKRGEKRNDNNDGLDLLSTYMSEHDDKFLKDTILNFVMAGRGTISSTLSWFFWLVSKNQEVEAKIREELKSKVARVKESQQSFTIEEVNKLPYLHGALCEALRLYPPVPFIHKEPLKRDVLPSGHRVDEKVKVFLSVYGLGRMKSVWGDDCFEFKPERWITESGGIKHEASYKFLAFNAGPRSCLGKEVAYTQMKIVVASIIHNYNVEVVEGHPVYPKLSVILHMKHGLMVNVSKRWNSSSTDDGKSY